MHDGVSPALASIPPGRSALRETLRRVGIYTLRRVVVLLATVVVGTYLAVLIANWGGEGRGRTRASHEAADDLVICVPVCAHQAIALRQTAPRHVNIGAEIRSQIDDGHLGKLPGVRQHSTLVDRRQHIHLGLAAWSDS